MRKTVNFGLAILVVFMFVTTVAVSTGNGDFFKLGVAEAAAGPDESCFIKTPTACPMLPGGGGGGERVMCDWVDTRITDAVCAPVKCITGVVKEEEHIKCDGNIPPIREIGD